MTVHHKKAVIVLGLARGGTNIVWNILQSHPQLGSTIGELSAVLQPTSSHHVRGAFNRLFAQPLFRLDPMRRWIGTWFDQRFYNNKMRGIDDIYARQKSENELYTHEELAQTALLTKGTNQDMYLIDLIEPLYQELHVIVVARNPYAVAESWLRRGHRVEKNARLYAHYMHYLVERLQNRSHWMLINFEDVLAKPFESAQQMFEFAHLDPPQLEKLRLKVKNVVNAQGERITYFGDPGGKYWFNRDNIHDLLNPAQSTLQSERLSPSDKAIIARYVTDIMPQLGYDNL